MVLMQLYKISGARLYFFLVRSAIHGLITNAVFYLKSAVTKDYPYNEW